MTETRTLSQKLLTVQMNLEAVEKSSENPYFNSKYANLNTILAEAKRVLHPEGLYLVQGPGVDAFGRYVETSIVDSVSNQQVSCRVPFSGNEKNMQEIIASTTYGRRAGIKSLLAMEDFDDDGETAVGRSTGKTTAQPRAKTEKQSPIQASASRVPTTNTVVGVRTESKETVSAPSAKPEVFKVASRQKTNEKISLTSKVIIDSKRATQEEVVAMLAEYGVKSKEELTNEQALELLTKLETKLNG